MAFETVKNAFQRNALIKSLAAVAAGGAAGIFLAAEKANKLSAADPSLVEVNAAVTNDKGEIAIRATAAGLAAAGTAAPEAAKAKEPAQTFVVESGIALVSAKRGGRVSNTYPFDLMAAPTTVDGKVVHASFHVPASATRPNPAKSLGSTVSSASRRYAVRDAAGKVTSYTKKFVIRPVDTSDPKGAGARVYRTI